MRMNFLRTAGIVLLLALFCGCRTQLVTVDVIPSDARVIANGVEYNNHSPVFIEASTGKQLAITAYKEGYKDKLYVIDYSLSSVGKVEAWTSFLILPAIGLFFDNAWQLKENNVTLVLEPVSQEAVKESDTSKPSILNGNDPSIDKTTDPEAKKIFNQI